MDLTIPVTLVVKAPNQKIGDQTIECGLGWTIKKLKEHIANVYPSKPRENQQKLIYSGRLLTDHLTLKDVLRQYDSDQTTHTVHLVCSPSVTELTQSTSQSNGETESSSGSSREDSPVSSVPSSPAMASGWEGLRHRPTSASESHPVTQAMPLPNTSASPHALAQGPFQNMFGGGPMMYGSPGFYQGMVPGMMPGMMAYSPEQMMWLQQMYAQQMAQYMQLYQGAMPAMQPASEPVAEPQQEAPAQQNEPAVVNAPANQRPADQPIRMNAQGGPVLDDDEDDVNRDWLDWVYTLSRMAVLLSIVYFYSTFSRFILVFSLFLTVYMYQAGWFNIQRRQQAQPEAEQGAPPDGPQGAPPEGGGVPREEEEEETPDTPPSPAPAGEEEEEQPQQDVIDGTDPAAAEGDETAPQEVPEPIQPGPLKVAWAFISTFFTSLIPQQPGVVNAN